IDPKEHSRLESQIFGLGNDILGFRALSQAFDTARLRLPIGGSEHLSAIFGNVATVRFSDSLAEMDRLKAAFTALEPARDVEVASADRDEYEAVARFRSWQVRIAGVPSPLVWLPAADPKDEEWQDL